MVRRWFGEARLAEAKPQTARQEEQGDEWTEWTQLNQVAGWTIWGRESQTSDAVQFLAAALDNEDREIYLQPEGEIGQEPHLFESQSTLQTALDAYQTRVENGEIDWTIERESGDIADELSRMWGNF